MAHIIAPCLGRQIQLGTLYDCRSDASISDANLWDAEMIRTNVNIQKSETVDIDDVTTDDSLEKKAQLLNINPNTKLSILVGLIKVDGAAKYFDDRPSSSKQARVVFKYSCKSHSELLPVNRIETAKINNRDAIENGSATHVAVGIDYGAEVYSIFDRPLADSEVCKEIEDKFQAVLSKMLIFNQGADIAQLTEEEKELANSFLCTFYGDVALNENPTSFEQALSILNNLPTYIRESTRRGDVFGVPTMVYLYPLLKLDNRAAALVQSISDNVVAEIQALVEGIIGVSVSVGHLENSKACQKFCGLKNQISQFKSSLAQFRLKLGEMVKAVRGGSMEEQSLSKMIQRVENSPFDPRKLETWLNQKKQEFDCLQSYLEVLQEFPFALEPKELEKFTKNVNVKHVLCITLGNIVGTEIDPYLESMKEFSLEEESEIDAEEIEESWCNEDSTTTTLQNQIALFLDFASANKSKTDLRFVVVAASSKKGKAEAPGLMILYTGGRRQVYQPPSAPGQPQMVSNAETEITISWSVPASGSKIVLSYEIFYQMVGGANDAWEHLATKGTESQVTVTKLSPGVEYVFKIEAVAELGKSQSSPQSHPIKTKSIVPALGEHQLATPGGNSLSIEPDKKVSLAEMVVPQCKEIKTGENGDPSWYQVPFRSSRIIDEKMLLREIEIGEPNTLTTKVKVVLFIGATGTGKSTLINGMVNFFLGVKWEDKFRLQLIPKESNESGASSQTKFVTKYVFHWQPGSAVDYTLIIIDSPGYGDTKEGIDRDNVLTSQFTEFFKTAIEHLDIVGYVVKASDERYTVMQAYIFDSLQTLFGHDIKQNIYLMFTFADGAKPLALATIIEKKIPYESFCKFNNSPFVAETADNTPMSKMFWDLAYAGYKYFFDKLACTKSSSLVLTRDVLENRRRLHETVEVLSRRIKGGLNKLSEMKKHLIFIIECEAKQQLNKNYEQTILVPNQRKIPIDDKNRYVTNCQNCNETCHDPCAYFRDEDKVGCVAIGKDGRCMSCKGRCHWKMHYHRNYIWEDYDESKTISNEVMQQLYGQACVDLSETDNMLLGLANEYIKIQEDVQGAIQHIHSCLKHLAKIALCPPPDSPIKYIDYLVTQAQRQNRDGSQSDYIQQLEKARQHAVYIKQMKEEGKTFDPFAKMREELKEMAAGSTTWREKICSFLNVETTVTETVAVATAAETGMKATVVAGIKSVKATLAFWSK